MLYGLLYRFEVNNKIIVVMPDDIKEIINSFDKNELKDLNQLNDKFDIIGQSLIIMVYYT